MDVLTAKYTQGKISRQPGMASSERVVFSCLNKVSKDTILVTSEIILLKELLSNVYFERFYYLHQVIHGYKPPCE